MKFHGSDYCNSYRSTPDSYPGTCVFGAYKEATLEGGDVLDDSLNFGVIDAIQSFIENKSIQPTKTKYESFCENILVIEEAWFSAVNLTDSVTFPPELIKCVKLIFDKNVIFHVTQSNTFSLFQ